MRRLKSIGLLLALPAMTAFLLHSWQPHVPTPQRHGHECAICQTPSLNAVPAAAAPIPIFFIAENLAGFTAALIETSFHSSQFSRGPPLA